MMGTLLATSSSTSSSAASTDTVVGKPIPAKRTKLSTELSSQSKSDPQTKGELAIISNGLTARPVPAPRTKLIAAREQARQEWKEAAISSAFSVINSVATETINLVSNNVLRDVTPFQKEYDSAVTGFDYLWEHKDDGEVTQEQLEFGLRYRAQSFMAMHEAQNECEKQIKAFSDKTLQGVALAKAQTLERIEANSHFFDKPGHLFFEPPQEPK
jgi:hypothetical protein